MKIKNRFIGLFFLALAAGGVSSHVAAAPSFTKEAGVRISSGLPQAFTGAYPDLRMYFIRGNAVYSSTSSDGLTWSEESGIRLSTATTPLVNITTITAATLLPLNAGGFRMLYATIDSTGVYRIMSATSADGLGWANETSTRIIVGTGLLTLTSPRLIELQNGDWKLYYVLGNSLFSDRSSDEGLTWSSPADNSIGQLMGEIAVSTLTDQQARIVYTSSASAAPLEIRSARASSAAGTAGFSVESGVRLSTDTGFLSFPLLTRSTETFRWRMYYAYRSSAAAIPQIHSALTITPDVRSVSPSAVLRSDPSAALAITGEIFSTAPTVTVTRSGETDITATSVVRADDQSITCAIATLNKANGNWSVTVTNSDTLAGTLVNGLLVTFGSGDVVLINNILRPRENSPVQIRMRVNEAGQVHVRIYTLEGKLIRTVSDTDLPVGASVLTWDGRNDDGNVVGSGTYVIKSSGPKLNDVQKIVVIR